MQRSTDQTGRTIEIADQPKRIISVVPSLSELLSDLRLNDEVIGLTKFCIHPDEWFRNKTRVGGTKNLNIELIRSLNPDLIIANKEENEQHEIEALAAEFPVWISDIYTFTDAKRMILAIGQITNRYFESVSLLKNIDAAFDELRFSIKEYEPTSVAYFIWNKPMMVAGGDTYISQMLEACGLENVFGKQNRYPEVTVDQVKASNPDMIFLSSEPFPFKQGHLDEFREKFPGTKSFCVDGELFSWYGSRMQYAPTYFLKLLEQIQSV